MKCLIAILTFLSIATLHAQTVDPKRNCATAYEGASAGCSYVNGIFQGGLQGAGSENAAGVFNLTQTGPGLNANNGSQGWLVSKGIVLPRSVSVTPGITQLINGSLQCAKEGDCAWMYGYLRSWDAPKAPSDEGVTGLSLDMMQGAGGFTSTPVYYQGTATASAATGATYIPLSSPGTDPGGNVLATGLYLTDTSQVLSSGHMTATRRVTGGRFLNELTVSSAVALDNAMGIFSDSISPGPDFATGVTSTHTLAIHSIPGATNAFTTGVGCLLGTIEPEQVAIKAIERAGSSQSVTFTSRFASAPGAILVQGTQACAGLSFDADVALTGFQTFQLAVGGVTDTSHLAYVSYMTGSPYSLGNAANTGNPLPRLGAEAANFTPGTNGYHLYPMAQIVNNTQAVGVTGYTLEPNRMTVAKGDALVNSVAAWQGGTGIFLKHGVWTPSDYTFKSVGLYINPSGYGISGGYLPFRMLLNNRPSWYCTSQSKPGTPCVAPVPAMQIEGAIADGIQLINGPAPGNTALSIQNTFYGTNTHADSFNLLSMPNGAALKYDPSTGATTLTGHGGRLGVSHAVGSTGSTDLNGGIRLVADQAVTLGFDNHQPKAEGAVPANGSIELFGIATDGTVRTYNPSTGGIENYLDGYRNVPGQAYFAGNIFVGDHGGSPVCLKDGTNCPANLTSPHACSSTIAPLPAPATSSAPCTAGQFADDAKYHYVCVAANTWKRVALSTF